MLETGKLYTYKEICTLRQENTKTGKSKQLQLHNWNRFFTWDQITSHKFLITNIYDTPKEKIDGRQNNGGSRVGSGRKKTLTKEFEYLLNYFLVDARRKNEYYLNYSFHNTVYFTNDVLSKAFGCYRDIYSAFGDEATDKTILKKVADKLREKTRSLVLNRLKSAPGIALSSGILAYKKAGGQPYIEDRLLNDWLSAQQRFLDMNNLNTVRDVVIQDQWHVMINYITIELCRKYQIQYSVIKKVHKITFDFDSLKAYDYEVVKQCMSKYNFYIMKSIYQYFQDKERHKMIQDSEAQELIALLMSLDTDDNPGSELSMEEILQVFEDDQEPSVPPIDEKQLSTIMEPYKYILKNYIAI